jgi:hypothetical protein
MADKKLNTRRLSFKQHHDLIEPQKSKEKETSESTLTTPRMLSKSQKPQSPPKIVALQKSNSEKQSEINAEMKSLSPRKSLSPLNLNKLVGEINFIPSDEVVGIQTQEHLNTSPYKDSTISSTRITTPPDNITSHSVSKEPVSPSSAKIVRQVSRAGAVKFNELPEFYQELIKKNNGVITSPKDLAHLFFIVETECGKVEPSANKMNTLFRGEAKIIDIPKESGVENINLYEIYWGFLGKESFDNEELKKIRLKINENYDKCRETLEAVVKMNGDKNILKDKIGFAVVTVILEPLIEYLIGGDVVFNKLANEKIERQSTKLSKLLCEFIFTIDEKIINWFEEHKNSNENELIKARTNSFTGLSFFRGLIKIWTDTMSFQDAKNLEANQKNHAVIKMINNFINLHAEMFFQKIVLCSDAEKKEILEQSAKELELIYQQQKIESRKKEIMHSMSSVNLPKDKFLSKTGNRNSQPYYGSVRESLSPRHKSYSLSLSEKIQQQEKEQFIDEVIQKLNIPLLLVDFKKDFKQSLLGLLGREIKIFEKRPFLTCKDHLMAYLAVNEDVQIKDIQGFMDKLNEAVKREVNEMEQEKRIKGSSKGEDNSPRKGGQELSPEKEKE